MLASHVKLPWHCVKVVGGETEGGNEQVGKDLVIKAEDLDSKVIDTRRLLQLIVQTRALSQ